MRVLLVEDDAALARAIAAGLRQAGHAIDCVRSLAQARAALAANHGYAAVLLDLGLPDGDGLELVDHLREDTATCAILILSARDQIMQRVAGLDRGADDYLVKPFDLDELLARLRAAMRRVQGTPEATLSAGNICIDVNRRRVTSAGRQVALSPREFALLAELARRRGQVVNRQVLEDALYAWGDEIESNAVEVYVHHIRRKLGAGVIRTTRGHGYSINDDDG